MSGAPHVPVVSAPIFWRMRFHVGQRVWLGFRDAVIESIGADGIVLRRTRRAGVVRLKYTPSEAERLVVLDMLREYEPTPKDRRHV